MKTLYTNFLIVATNGEECTSIIPAFELYQLTATATLAFLYYCSLSQYLLQFSVMVLI